MSLPIRQTIVAALFVAVWATFAGCRTADDSFTPYLTRIYLEESANLPESRIREMVLPISGTRVTVGAKAKFFEWDIQRAVHFETDLGRAVMFMFTSAAAEELYRQTVANQGKTLILTVNGLPVGGRYIDAPIQDGRLAFFLEIDSEEIPEVVERIQETSDRIRERMNRESGW